MALEKAYFVEMDEAFKNEKGKRVDVQFNPESLKVNFTNQVEKPASAGNQTGPAAIQFVGSGTTKMSAQLWFDSSISASDPAGKEEVKGDVRQLTKQIADFMTAVEVKTGPGAGLFAPKFLRFNWGTFKFDGIMDSFEENVEFFSPDGIPKRASATFSLLQQAIQFAFGQQRSPGAAGNAPLASAPQGSSLQAMASAAGRPGDWQAIAAANGIENPRMLATGQLVDMSADITGGVSAGIGVGALGSVSIGAGGAVGGGSVGIGASVSAGAGVRIG